MTRHWAPHSNKVHVSSQVVALIGLATDGKWNALHNTFSNPV
jgi:hypothetical protein